MKINIGPQARIVGTKKVGPRGTVAGLSEFAGRDVLIVVPTQAPRYTPTASDVLVQVRSTAAKQGRELLKEYRSFRQRYFKKAVPGTGKLLEVSPAALRPRIRQADAWVRQRAQRFEERADKLLKNVQN